MGLLDGKNALIFGLANERSIAWGITQAFKREGANLGLSYAGEALERRVKPLAAGAATTPGGRSPARSPSPSHCPSIPGFPPNNCR